MLEVGHGCGLGPGSVGRGRIRLQQALIVLSSGEGGRAGFGERWDGTRDAGCGMKGRGKGGGEEGNGDTTAGL